MLRLYKTLLALFQCVQWLEGLLIDLKRYFYSGSAQLFTNGQKPIIYDRNFTLIKKYKKYIIDAFSDRNL